MTKTPPPTLPLFNTPRYKGYFTYRDIPKETPLEVRIAKLTRNSDTYWGGKILACNVEWRDRERNESGIAFGQMGYVWLDMNTPEEDRRRIVEDLVRMRLLGYNIVDLYWNTEPSLWWNKA